jgi:hypothetical protein
MAESQREENLRLEALKIAAELYRGAVISIQEERFLSFAERVYGFIKYEPEGVPNPGRYR